MLERRELAAALLVGVLAVSMKLTAPRVALVPIGFAGGIVVGLFASPRDPWSDGALAGAKSGVGGAVVYAIGAVAVETIRLLSLLPPGFVVDWVVFQSFALVIMLIPLYAIEGFVAAPFVQWLVGVATANVRAAGTER